MIRSAVDDLKRNGASLKLPITPGAGMSPLSPSMYVFLCVFSQTTGKRLFAAVLPESVLGLLDHASVSFAHVEPRSG